MAINRFNRPVNNQLISQHVPKDMNMIAKVLASKQQRYDVETNKMEVLQDQITQLSGVGPVDLDIIRGKGTELNSIAQEYSNKDLSDPRIAKELRGKAKMIANDPLLKNTQTSLAAVQQYQKDKQKMMLDGEYRPENDAFAQQYQQYLQTGASEGPLTYNGLIKGVDERAAAEKYFDNIPKSGQYGYAQLGDTVKKVGWEGISEGQINSAMNNSISAFASSSAGQQAMRRYNLMEQQGQLPEGASARKYLAGILASAGMERVGGIGTSGAGDFGGSGGSGTAGFGTNTDNQIATQFTPKTAKGFSGVSFKEDGSIKGEGSSSYIDVAKGDKGFWDVFSDDTLSEEDIAKYKPIIDLAEAQGITHQEAATKLERRIAPQFVPLSGTKQKNITNAFFDKGAGISDTMTVTDENGEDLLSNEVFEEAGLLDSDGNFDPDVAKQKGVKVDGILGVGNGVVPSGYYVSIGTKNYIFEKRNPNPQEVKGYIQAQLDTYGYAKVPDYVNPNTGYVPGTTYIRDANDKTHIIDE